MIEINFAELFAGAASVAAIIYGYMKVNGLKILPKELEEDVCKAIGNVSLGELRSIVCRANELKQGGFTVEELQELGRLVLEATKD